MSTPSTLPPHHPAHGFSHPHNYQSVNGYRGPGNLLHGASRLGGAPSSAVASSATAVAPVEHAHIPPRTLSTLVAHTAAPMAAVAASALPRKRPRSREPREPDWNDFYKNGLPKEVIIIDDSPEPDTASLTHSYAVRGSDDAQTGHMAKKRKRDGTGQAAYEPIYPPGTTVNQHTAAKPPHSQSASTISTDRTESAHLTTAHTSLGSYSSGALAYPLPIPEAQAQAGQKRKRTATRSQNAAEAKRKEWGTNGDTWLSYRPPPLPPLKSGEVHVKQIPDNSATKDQPVDDKEGHYIVVPDTDIADRYQINKLLGQGTFGKVVQARDRRKNNKLVAIKIIRSVQKYRDASRIELRVLSTLKMNDPENRNRCIHLRDCFDYRGHICIVMDLLGQSVFDFLKSNGFVPFPNSQIQSFARQLFMSVAFLHDLNLVHTDLKPENILLCDSAYQAFTYSRRIPSSSTSVNRQAAQRRVLLDTEIRLIDFGSATFEDEYHSSVVSTRHYRAPEIILGIGWSYPCDIWSIGCILVEFFTGDALFQTHDNLEHLAMMEAVCGRRIDVPLVQSVNEMAKRGGGNPAAEFFKRNKLDYPQPETTRASKRFVKAMKRLKDIIPDTSRFSRLFLDLLLRIFTYDPKRRITAKEALQHPWFSDTATPDDGTEAIRIKMQRQQEAAELAARRQRTTVTANGYHR